MSNTLKNDNRQIFCTEVLNKNPKEDMLRLVKMLKYEIKALDLELCKEVGFEVRLLKCK